MTPSHAYLNNLFSDSLSPVLSQVLYQLFDWPNQPGSRLGIIGISNTHDLDQRVLPRIASRLDQAKLAFAPYSVSQLQEIVKGRLEASGVAGAVEDSAVQLACRKVASETGEGTGNECWAPCLVRSGGSMHAIRQDDIWHSQHSGWRLIVQHWHRLRS